MLVTSPHDNIVDNYPEINDWLGTGPNGAKTGTEGETEEDDAERVGAGPVCEGPPVLPGGGVPHLPRPGLHTDSQPDTQLSSSTHSLESCLKQVVRDEVPAEVQEVVHDVALLVGQQVGGGGVDLRPGSGVTRVGSHHQAEAHHGGEEGGQDEEENCPQSDHSIHLNLFLVSKLCGTSSRVWRSCAMSAAAWKSTGSSP